MTKTSDMTYHRRARRIVESVLGKPLSTKHPIHHLDGNHKNNSKNNLVICENRTYHVLLDMRTQAFLVCGKANWRKCVFCKQYDALKNLSVTPTSTYHKSCNNNYYHNVRKVTGSLAKM